MKNSKLALLLFIIIVVGIVVGSAGYLMYNVLDIKEIPYNFTVKRGIMGFDVRNDIITFGTIPPKGHATRTITLASGKEATAVIKVSGEGADWITASDNNCVLVPGYNKSVNLTVLIPPEAPEGQYRGKISVFIYRR